MITEPLPNVPANAPTLLPPLKYELIIPSFDTLTEPSHAPKNPTLFLVLSLKYKPLIVCPLPLNVMLQSALIGIHKYTPNSSVSALITPSLTTISALRLMVRFVLLLFLIQAFKP